MQTKSPLSRTPVRKAVFPVAGLGTRFLPATKAIPKEMLPIVDRPLIQMAVDEAKSAGIEHFVFVTGRNKGVIEDYFDKQYELEAELAKSGKQSELSSLQDILPKPGQASFTRQQQALGLGHAVWCARDLIGNEPFAVLLPDVVIKSKPTCMQQLMDVYNQVPGSNIIAVEEVAPEILHRYGVVKPGQNLAGHFKILDMVEKPDRGEAPSNLAITGRYIFQPGIFSAIEQFIDRTEGEVQLTDAMVSLLKTNEFYGVTYSGQSFDCGDKSGYIAANLAFALERPDIGEDVRRKATLLLQTTGGRN